MSRATVEPRLSLKDVCLTFGSARVLDRASLTIHASEVMVVLGNSGCGKTTLLKVASGLLQPDSGLVLVDGQPLQGIPVRERRVVYLDQEALLFEHLNVFDNIAFGLRLRRVDKLQTRERVERLLEAIGLGDHVGKRSWQLSGGQRQRIAFARAILAEPRILLLDEPFGSLDPRSRAEMQVLFQTLAKQYQFTAAFVTHDVREALVIGDRFATMHQGVVQCYGDREAFVADERSGVQNEIQFWQRIADTGGASQVSFDQRKQ